MKKLLKVLVVLLVLLMIILPAAWLTMPRWLPAVVKSSLPDGVTLSLSQPKIRTGGLSAVMPACWQAGKSYHFTISAAVTGLLMPVH